MSTVYIAGKMRGIPYYNFPAFDSMRDRLLALGYNVISPADGDRDAGFDPTGMPPDSDWTAIPEGFDFGDCFDRCVAAVKRCDVILLMNGWRRSRGARAEHALGVWQGKVVLYQRDISAAEKAIREMRENVKPNAAGEVRRNAVTSTGLLADESKEAK
jgi:hypothetical protein